MSRFPPVQRYLGWLQRFLYQVEVGEVPPVIPMVEVNHDWPTIVEYRRFLPVSIIGTVATTVYQPPEGKHGLVFLAEGGELTGTPTGDVETYAMDLSRNQTPFARVAIIRNLLGNLTDWNFIGSVSYQAPVFGAINVPVVQQGAPPVYVGPGCTLRHTVTSNVAGNTFFVQIAVIEVPSFMPLRLP